MERYSGESQINIGWGEDVTISELAKLVAAAVGFTGEFRFDATKSDGAPQKLLDVGKLDAMGWHPRIHLGEGLADSYRWFVEHA
jgi:GDP-L-fucose synthase